MMKKKDLELLLIVVGLKTLGVTFETMLKPQQLKRLYGAKDAMSHYSDEDLHGKNEKVMEMLQKITKGK